MNVGRSMFHYGLNEIRVPATLDEAVAAVDYAETRLDAIEERLAHGAPEEHGAPSRWRADMEVARDRWSAKLTELLYHCERLKASDDDLARCYAEAHRRAEDLAERVRELSTHPGACMTDPRVAELTRENLDLKRRCTKLQVDVENQRAALARMERRDGPVAEDAKQRLLGGMHGAYAFGVAALDEMVAAGARLTPLAASFRQRAEASVPKGYLAAWNAGDGAFVRAAVQRAAATGRVRVVTVPASGGQS